MCRAASYLFGNHRPPHFVFVFVFMCNSIPYPGTSVNAQVGPGTSLFRNKMKTDKTACSANLGYSLKCRNETAAQPPDKFEVANTAKGVWRPPSKRRLHTIRPCGTAAPQSCSEVGVDRSLTGPIKGEAMLQGDCQPFCLSASTRILEVMENVLSG